MNDISNIKNKHIENDISKVYIKKRNIHLIIKIC